MIKTRFAWYAYITIDTLGLSVVITSLSLNIGTLNL
jgi:hypothetical protein